MADHAQQQILDAVQAALIAAATAAGSRVYLDRTDELPEDQLSAIDILGGDETGEDAIENVGLGWPPIQRHVFSFAVSSVTRSASGSAEAARNLAKQVEAALGASAAAIVVGGTSIAMRITASSGQKSPAGNQPMAAQRQTWEASYHTQAGSPDAIF